MELHDLRERMDASFGNGPQHLPVAQVIGSGRRAMLRRRVASGVGALGLSTIVLVAPFMLSQDDAARGPIKQPSESPRIGQPFDLPVDTSWRADCGAGLPVSCDTYLDRHGPMGYRSDGTLTVVSADVNVWLRVDNPLVIPGGASAAVEAELGGSLRWWLVARTADGRVITREYNPSGIPVDFETWVDSLPDLAAEQGRIVPTLPPRGPVS
ncbi:MAG TPA: hypothetical protein VLI04_23085 [Nocardioidaceae bacterium]|nr:hypothetical protein [Nocardioidaceae bacterium]